MPISESKNRANRAWDRDNMRTVSCRVRTEDAIEFSEYCKENKAYIHQHAVSCNAIFTCIFQKLCIVKHTYKGH